jgi:Flp pilus assembly secretin CpaC
MSSRPGFSVRRVALAYGGAITLMLAFAGMATANDKAGALDTIAVQLDQAKLLKLPGGTETIVVGNPSIADVAVQKNGVMVITGRTPGRTNFIALDGSGTIISESIVSVSGGSEGRLLVQRGLERQSYDCAPRCLPTVSLGDEDKHFNGTIDQSVKRDGMANQSSSNPNKK